MTPEQQVRVRILRPVTHGDVSWQAGDEVRVAPELAAVMVKAGEAVYPRGLDTTVALGVIPSRTR